MSGLGLQLIIGLVMLFFGLTGSSDSTAVPPLRGDTTFLYGAVYILLGTAVWLSLIIVFHQHGLERLEALEEDELAASHGGSALFEGDESRVAARRLRIMHQWMMPGLSLVLAAILALMAWRMLSNDAEFVRTASRGWGISICLAGALISFIFSRYIAGMAKQPAWQNLRGGAGYMVGNALVMLAIAVGLAFRFFDNDHVINVIAVVIPIFMLAVAAEIVLNFVLHLYRPRIPGEVPRPAFDSRVLALLSAPDSLVRSVNEAVNYQFGFDVTSSWGYQLLLRSFLWLIGFGVLVMLVLSSIQVVEPHQQALRLRGGRQVGEVHGSGLMFKWPWPLETAELFEVARVRRINLTAVRTAPKDIDLWADEFKKQTDEDPEPFLVGVTPIDETVEVVVEGDDGVPIDERALRVSRRFSLLNAEMKLEYRIKSDPAEGLSQFLNLAEGRAVRNHRLDMAELTLKNVALREISQTLARLPLDDILAKQRGDLAGELRSKVQARFDALGAGVEVVAITVPLLRPPDELHTQFEDLAFAKQQRQQRVDEERQRVELGLSQVAGTSGQADALYAAIVEYDEMRRGRGNDDPEVRARRVEIKDMFLEAGGAFGGGIAIAETNRWVRRISEETKVKAFEGQLAAYRAAPEIYAEREKMDVFIKALAGKPKFVLGIDPSRVNFNVDLGETASEFDFSRSQNSEDSQ